MNAIRMHMYVDELRVDDFVRLEPEKKADILKSVEKEGCVVDTHPEETHLYIKGIPKQLYFVMWNLISKYDIELI